MTIRLGLSWENILPKLHLVYLGRRFLELDCWSVLKEKGSLTVLYLIVKNNNFGKVTLAFRWDLAIDNSQPFLHLWHGHARYCIWSWKVATFVKNSLGIHLAVIFETTISPLATRVTHGINGWPQVLKQGEFDNANNHGSRENFELTAMNLGLIFVDSGVTERFPAWRSSGNRCPHFILNLHLQQEWWLRKSARQVWRVLMQVQGLRFVLSFSLAEFDGIEDRMMGFRRNT